MRKGGTERLGVANLQLSSCQCQSGKFNVKTSPSCVSKLMFGTNLEQVPESSCILKEECMNHGLGVAHMTSTCWTASLHELPKKQ